MSVVNSQKKSETSKILGYFTTNNTNIGNRNSRKGVNI